MQAETTMDNGQERRQSCPSVTAEEISSSSNSPTKSAEEEETVTDAKGFNFKGYQEHLKKAHPDLPLIKTWTEKDSSTYDLSQGRKVAVIFNHKKYQDDYMSERHGTEEDVRAITETFSKLNFEISCLNNPTVDEIELKLEAIQQEEDLSCLALFILTHGEEDGLLHAFDSSYRLHKTVIPQLLPDRCTSLAGKPKLIFIQACQGQETDPGVLLQPSSRDAAVARKRHTSADKAWLNLPYCIPNFVDLLIFAAAYSGQYSFRSTKEGSWFIQALCQKINEARPDEDLVSVLTKVSRQIALYKESYVPTRPDLDRKKQVPLKQDTLIRKVFLNHQSDATQPINDRVHNIVTNKEPLVKRDNNCLCM